MQKETTKPAKRVLKKLSATHLKVQAGDRLEGEIIGFSEIETVIAATGEVKILKRLHLRNLENEILIVNMDAGLKGALADAMVGVGARVVLEKGEKRALTGGRTVNTWDVFGYDDGILEN